MKFPSLSVRIKKNSLRGVYQFLQGVSRYIGAIYINRATVDNIGLKAVNTLVLRYPKKRIIFELQFNQKNFFEFLEILLQKTNLLFYAILFPRTCNVNSKTLIRIQQLFADHQKTGYFFVNESNYHLFTPLAIEHLGYYKNLEDGEEQEWEEADYRILTKLNRLKRNVKLFNISSQNLKALQKQNVQINEIVAGSDVAFSFNPVESCKQFYSTIKEMLFQE